MSEQVKSYLSFEGHRNRKGAALFERLVKIAYGASNAVIVGHHITFEDNGDLSTENEIASADCLLFDHEIMSRVFGDRFKDVLLHLASVPCDERDELAAQYLTERDNLQALERRA